METTRLPKHPGDKGEHYLVRVSEDGEFLKTIHRREGVEAIGYSVTRIDCKTARYQDLAYEENIDNVARIYPEREWIELVEGSSKWHLVKYVCEHYGKWVQIH